MGKDLDLVQPYAPMFESAARHREVPAEQDVHATAAQSQVRRGIAPRLPALTVRLIRRHEPDRAAKGNLSHPGKPEPDEHHILVRHTLSTPRKDAFGQVKQLREEQAALPDVPTLVARQQTLGTLTDERSPF